LRFGGILTKRKYPHEFGWVTLGRFGMNRGQIGEKNSIQPSLVRWWTEDESTVWFMTSFSQPCLQHVIEIICKNLATEDMTDTWW